MGAALYIVVDSEEPGFDTFVNGKALAQAEGKLAEAAQRAGVTPLMDFFGVSPADLEGVAEEFEAAEDVTAVSATEAWFDPEDGLRTVGALLATLESDPAALGAHVRDELLELSSVLSQAKQRGLRWHLAVDY
jgi:hypothetical protein